MSWSVNPLGGKTINRRAGCGKSASPVRREGRPNSIGLPYPYAQQWLAIVSDLAELSIAPEAAQLADYLFAYLHLPDAAAPDAVHLAVASHYAVDYLLTWNLKHLANGRVRRALEHLSATQGIFIPTICTPEELSDWEDVL